MKSFEVSRFHKKTHVNFIFIIFCDAMKLLLSSNSPFICYMYFHVFIVETSRINFNLIRYVLSSSLILKDVENIRNNDRYHKISAKDQIKCIFLALCSANACAQKTNAHKLSVVEIQFIHFIIIISTVVSIEIYGLNKSTQ